MTRGGVIKTYLTNFNLYKHLLSLEKREDDHKNKIHIYVKNTLLILKKKEDTTKIIKYAQLKNILATKDNRYNYYFFILH